jgi:hypothetical protein
MLRQPFAAQAVEFEPVDRGRIVVVPAKFQGSQVVHWLPSSWPPGAGQPVDKRLN